MAINLLTSLIFKIMDITWFNKNFRFVFTPNFEQINYNYFVDSSYGCYSSRRFLVGAGSISEYITEKNAETVLKTAEKMKTDKSTVKFRKYGKIEIYVK